MAKWQNKQNKSAADLLAQETLDKMKARNDARKENFGEFMSKWSFRRVLGVLLVFLPLAFLAGAIFIFNNTNESLRANDAAIASLESQIAAKQSEIDALAIPQADAEYIRTSLNSARVAGVAVADLQNKYCGLKNAFHLNNTAANGNLLTENAVAIGVYFNDDEHESRSVAQGSWYFSERVEYTWTFETTYEFKAGSCECLWTCYSKDGVLLAYATSVYDVTSGLFGDFAFFQTLAGTSYTETSDPPLATPTPEPEPTAPTTESTVVEESSAPKTTTKVTDPTPPLPSDLEPTTGD